MADESQDKLLHDLHSEACNLICKGILLHLKAQGVEAPDPIAEDEDDEELYLVAEDAYPGYSILKKSEAVMNNFNDDFLKECPVILNGEIELNNQIFKSISKNKTGNGIDKFVVKFTTKLEYEVNGKGYKL